MDLAVGPYSGKETGETALLRSLLESFHPGDLLVADRYYCSFFLIALRLSRGVQVCARMHHKRPVDFRRGRRLGSRDHQIVWTKPARPDWMSPATYDSLPNELVLRELRFSVVVPGRRTSAEGGLTIATTLTDVEIYSKADIAELDGFRWNAELDPPRRTELQPCPLQISRDGPQGTLDDPPPRTGRQSDSHDPPRRTAAALLHDQQPRQISFTETCQSVLASWMLMSCNFIPPTQEL